MKVSVRSAAAPEAGEVTVTSPTEAAPAVSPTRAAVKGASPIAGAGLVANLANIGVTLAVARLLSTREYGGLNQLVAVFFVLSIPGSALLVGIVRRVTLWQRNGQSARVAGWAYRTRRRALLVVVVWAVIAIAIRGPLSGWLSLPGPGGLSETLIAGAVWGVLCIERGLLQSTHAYKSLGSNLLVEGLTRCLLTIGLVGIGLGVSGAALAILLSVLLAEAHALTAQGIIDRRALRRAAAGKTSAAAEPVVQPSANGPITVSSTASSTVSSPAPIPAAAVIVAPEPAAPTVPAVSAAAPAPLPQPTSTEQRQERRTLASDLLIALTALALLAILQNFDVVLLGRQAPGNAGSYAPISVACKPLVLAAFVLAGFLLPEAAARRHAGQHALRQLGVVLAVIAVPALLLIILSTAVPTQLLRFAFGPRLTAAAPAFSMLALAMTLLAATVLFTHYLLAAGRPLVLIVLLLGAGLTVALLVHANGALVGTARADLIGQAVVAIAAGGLVLHTARPRGHASSVG